VEAGRGLEAASIVTRALDADLSRAERVAAQTLLSRAHFGRGDLEGAGAALEVAVALAEHDSQSVGPAVRGGRGYRSRSKRRPSVP
jgi:hypothetical protein